MARKINVAKSLSVDVTPKDLIRFLGYCKPDDESSCWFWQAHCDDYGYGQFKQGGKMHWAHRWAYAAFVGRIPARLQVDHICRNPSCVNPNHLRITSHSKHVADHNRLRGQDVFGNYLAGRHGFDPLDN